MLPESNPFLRCDLLVPEHQHVMDEERAVDRRELGFVEGGEIDTADLGTQAFRQGSRRSAGSRTHRAFAWIENSPPGRSRQGGRG